MNKIVYLSYSDLTMCYRRLHEYDNAIEIGKRKIEALKEANQDYTHAMRELEISIRLKQDNYLSNLKKESESLYYCNQFDEALPLLKEAIELGTDRYQTFKFTSHIYIIKKDKEEYIQIINSLPTELEVEITVDKDLAKYHLDEEDLIADEITLETNRLVKTFKYTILEEK